MSAEEGFLSRWSRRKRGAGAAPEAMPAPPASPPEAAEPPVFDPASLPPVESLTAASDFTAFLRAEVPAALRQAALRRAWTLDPAIRDFIGPADYAWDYNAPDGVPGFALELGGDGKRLLAQAIGVLEDVVAPSVEPPRAMPAPEAPPRLAEAAPEDAPVALAGVALAGEADTEAPPDPPPMPRPRRHGGAMPV